MSSDAIAVVSSVVEIERQAESMLMKAAEEAKRIVGEASEKLESARRQSEGETIAQIKKLEAEALLVREKLVEDINTKGKKDLEAVATLSNAVFDKGVLYLIGELRK